jgi:mono/diheme cytochrome c family protein
MRKVLNLFGVAAMAASLCAGGTGAARAQDAPKGDAPKGDVAEGKRLYMLDGCFTCHGRSGQGGRLNGPAPVIAKTAMPFDGFLAQLRNPVNEMPAYATPVMSDQQIADIYAFVQSLPGPLPGAKDMPIFKD